MQEVEHPGCKNLMRRVKGKNQRIIAGKVKKIFFSKIIFLTKLFFETNTNKEVDKTKTKKPGDKDVSPTSPCIHH